jgi:hypothetical protein
MTRTCHCGAVTATEWNGFPAWFVGYRANGEGFWSYPFCGNACLEKWADDHAEWPIPGTARVDYIARQPDGCWRTQTFHAPDVAGAGKVAHDAGR